MIVLVNPHVPHYINRSYSGLSVVKNPAWEFTDFGGGSEFNSKPPHALCGVWLGIDLYPQVANVANVALDPCVSLLNRDYPGFSYKILRDLRLCVRYCATIWKLLALDLLSRLCSYTPVDIDLQLYYPLKFEHKQKIPTLRHTHTPRLSSIPSYFGLDGISDVGLPWQSPTYCPWGSDACHFPINYIR